MRGTTCVVGMAHHLPVVNAMAAALDVVQLPCHRAREKPLAAARCDPLLIMRQRRAPWRVPDSRADRTNPSHSSRQAA